MVNFNPASIREAFPTCGFHRHLQIVPAYYYNDKTLTPANICDKVVIGILLSISFPDDKGKHYGAMQFRARMPAVNGKRPRIMTTHSYILTFVDVYAEPNCFSVMYYQKRDFLRFFGNNSAQAETIRVGDALAFLEPKPSGAVLGENVMILEKPERTTCITPQANWPVAPPTKSALAGHQNAFYIHHKHIRFFSPTLTNRDVACQNITCDAQSNNCKGCFGRRPYPGTRVLKTHVTVDNCPAYDSATQQADFFDFKSFRTSDIFFEDFGAISVLSEELSEHINSTLIRPHTEAMVTYINNHGGWTIAGWYRRGVVENSDTGETYVSSTTQGHLTLLYPSNPDVLQNDGYKSNLIQTPTYAMLHSVDDEAEEGDAIHPAVGAGDEGHHEEEAGENVHDQAEEAASEDGDNGGGAEEHEEHADAEEQQDDGEHGSGDDSRPVRLIRRRRV